MSPITKPMKVIICGAGQVGTIIAAQLSREGNDVTVIDYNEELVADIADHLDVKAIHGFASHPDVLQKAGAAEADMLIAVTYSDEVNMIACQVAHSLFNIPRKIARLRSQNYLDAAWKDLYRGDHMPIDEIISPELEVAKSVGRRLQNPGVLDMINFMNAELQVMVVSIDNDSVFANLPVKLIQNKFGDTTIDIIGMISGNNFEIPGDNTIVHPGDKLYFAVSAADTQKSLSILGIDNKSAERILILGGGNIGFWVAEALEKSESETKVKIVEMSKSRAEYLAGVLEDTLVVNGDGINEDILMEVNVQTTDTIITVTNDDEVNILGALLAKRYGAQRSIALVNNMLYVPMLTNLGIDAVVNPRETTTSTILQHVRKGKVENVYSIMGGDAEIVQARATSSSALVGKKVSEVQEKGKIKIAAIMRDSEILLAEKDMMINEKDDILIISVKGMSTKVEKLFAEDEGYY